MSDIIENEDVSHVGNGEECDPDPQFKPIITLPEVEVSLNEDHEVEMLKIRAKLYRFDSHSDPPEWKERGTGELKLLKNKENSSMRIVMRRDKTLKICANHFLTPKMELTKNVSCDRAFVYTVFADFADEELKSELFAVKFGSVENANLFKTKFEEAQEILKKECNLYNGTLDHEHEDESESETEDSTEDKENKEANLEITSKLSELDVNKKEDEKVKK